jgi:hypothetical protein
MQNVSGNKNLNLRYGEQMKFCFNTCPARKKERSLNENRNKSNIPSRHIMKKVVGTQMISRWQGLKEERRGRSRRSEARGERQRAG